MAPSEHLDWFDGNVDWFARLPVDALAVAVPNCPGWTVETVLTHLTFGLGLCYPAALETPPGGDEATAFADVPWPMHLPVGSAAISAFSDHLSACAETFRSTDPNRLCWTYAGPGRARFWFRRAAIETTLHRMDVADALGLAPAGLPRDRAADAVAETVSFALPFAASIVGEPIGGLTIRCSDGSQPSKLGKGALRAEIVGDAVAVLAALWGRSRGQVEVRGDQATARSWLGLIETAFAGR